MTCETPTLPEDRDYVVEFLIKKVVKVSEMDELQAEIAAASTLSKNQRVNVMGVCVKTPEGICVWALGDQPGNRYSLKFFNPPLHQYYEE